MSSHSYLNQPIFYQDVAKRSWTPGKIIGCGPEPRSFTVGNTGRQLRRNRILLRPRQVTFQQEVKTQHNTRREKETMGYGNSWPTVNTEDSMNTAAEDGKTMQNPSDKGTGAMPPPVSPDEKKTRTTTANRSTAPAEEQPRRSTRQRRPPDRLQNYTC